MPKILFTQSISVRPRPEAQIMSGPLGVDTLAAESYTDFIESTFLNMCAVPCKAIFCDISRCGVPGSCLIHLSLVFLIIPKFQITTGMSIVFMFHTRFISISRSLYLDNVSTSFRVIFCSDGVEISIM